MTFGNEESESELRRWRLRASMASIAIFSLVLVYPMYSDLAIYQWMTLRLLHDGALPYVGSWDHNFPGILLFHILPILCFGNSEVGFRVFEAILQVACAICLFQLLSRWLMPRPAFVAVVLYAIFNTHFGVLYVGERDVFAMCVFVIGIALWLRDPAKRSTASLLGCGLLFGLATLIRPLYFPIALGLLIIYRKQLSLRDMGLFCGAAILPLLVSTVPYLVSGHIQDYYESVVLYNSNLYTTQVAPFSRFLIHLLHFSPLILFGLLGILPRSAIVKSNVGVLEAPAKEEKQFLVFFIVSSLFIILVQRKYLVYHYAPIVPALAPLAAIGIERFLSLIARPRIQSALAVSLLGLLTIFFAPVLPVVKYVTAAVRLGHTDPTEYNRLLMVGDFTGVQMEDSVMHYLSLPENKSGAIEIVGFDGRLRARLADRPMATKFSMIQALALSRADGSRPDFQIRWRKEYIASLNNVPARFIVLLWHNGYWDLQAPREGLPKYFPELSDLIKTHYSLVQTYGGYEIYRRL